MESLKVWVFQFLIRDRDSQKEPDQENYKSFSLRQNNDILGRRAQNVLSDDGWRGGRLITDSSRLTLSREETSICVEPVTDRNPNSRTWSTLVWEYRVSSSELSVSSTLMILTWWWFGRSVTVTLSDLGHVLFWGDCHAGTHPTWGRARPGRAPGAPCSSPSEERHV